MTQFSYEQYQWQVKDGIARIVNPYDSIVDLPAHDGFENYLEIFGEQMATDAEDGVYSGDAFELLKQVQLLNESWLTVNWDISTMKFKRQFLKLKNDNHE